MKCLSFYLFLNVHIDRPNPVFMTGFVKTSVIFENGLSEFRKAV